MSFSQVKLQALTNRFINECDQNTQFVTVQKVYQIYKKYNKLDEWKINLFNFICNPNLNENMINELTQLLSNLNINDSISQSMIESNMNRTNTSIMNLSSDILMHCTQFLRLKDLLILQKCNRHLMVECYRPNALYYLDWQTDRYLANQYLSHFRFSQIQKLQIDHFDYNDYTIQPFQSQSLLLQQHDINTNINYGWFGFVKQLRINVVNEDYFMEEDNDEILHHHLIYYQAFCNKLCKFVNVSKLIYSNGRLDKTMTYDLSKFINAKNLRHLQLSSLKFDIKLVKNILFCENLEALTLTDIGMDLEFESFNHIGDNRKNISLPKLKYLNIESVDDIEHEMDNHSFCESYYSFFGHLLSSSDHKIEFSFEVARRQQIPMNKLFIKYNIYNICYLYFDGQLSASYQFLNAIKIKKDNKMLYNLRDITISFELQYQLELTMENVNNFVDKWCKFCNLTTNDCRKKLIWSIYEEDEESYKWSLLQHFVQRWYTFVNGKSKNIKNTMSFCFEIWNRDKFRKVIQSLNCKNLMMSNTSTLTLKCI